MSDKFYARPSAAPDGSINRDPATWQLLLEHLRAVGNRAQTFADKFSAASIGLTAGLWHDFGKYTTAFQKRLSGGPPCYHSIQGAARAAAQFGKDSPDTALALMLAIAGHHAGLDNPFVQGCAPLDWLEDRQEGAEQVQESRISGAEIDALRVTAASLPDYARSARLRLDIDAGEQPLAFEFFVRFLFSALVDADRLDAARFDRISRREAPDQELPARERIKDLRSRLHKHLGKVNQANTLEADPYRRRVFDYREAVLAACLERASNPAGVFTLSVATGGGKTLSSLAFALDHAIQNKLDRIIIAIPFTSIIEQTARVYRDILGHENVLEHHSNVALDTDVEGRPTPEQQARRLATENWNSPVIVTTNVQLLQSFFASSPSDCRKLHNIARSVIVFDEAQTIPFDKYAPICDALNQLTQHYGSSIVLCTATQPGLTLPKGRNAQGQSIPHVSGPDGRPSIEIMPDSAPRPPERVRVEQVGDLCIAIAWPDLARHVHELGGTQCLVIVHRREDAQVLTRLLDQLRHDEQTVHLSALMAPDHRSQVIAGIKQRLAARQPCIVVSTQLVEAGVDFSFPVVYRALGGIDSMTQAAGRANRNGELGEFGGTLRVFRAESDPPQGVPRQGLVKTVSILAGIAAPQDILSTKTCDRFFAAMASERASGGEINQLRRKLDYPEVAQRMKLIPDGGTPVVVPWPDAASTQLLVYEARSLNVSGERLGRTLRKLQHSSVSVYDNVLRNLQGRGAVEPIFPLAGKQPATLWVLSPAFAGLYSPRFGLMPNAEVDPTSFIVMQP
jgi:CRISPR-associated endonuclease/helicase Cas3